MNTLVLFCLAAVLTAGAALPQQRYTAPQPSTVQLHKVEVIEVPYQPGPASYYLVARQQTLPPTQTYGVPHQEYGPPPVPQEPMATTTEAVPEEGTTTEIPTTTESDATVSNTTEVSDVEQSAKLQEGGAREEGVYYIYHPTGQLQRVMYATNDDAKNMAFSAQLKYHNVEPIREPIYTYDPKTYVFQRLQV